MAFTLSAKAELLKDKTNIKQQIILEIDGLDAVFGAVDVTELLRFDSGFFFDDPTLFFDGVVVHPESRPYISLGGTTKRITQQLQQDKTANSSISSVKIELIDKNNFVTNLFTPGNYVDDILARRAQVYLGFQSGAHPQDSIKIFSGLIDNVEFGSGNVVINISHPEQFKRQVIFPLIQSEIDGAIDSSQTTITLTDTTGLLEPFGIFLTYIRIEDEIIQYTGISGNDLTGCTRGALLTSAAAHDDETETSSFYRFQEDPINLAIALMISGYGVFGNLDVANFNQLTATEYVQNAIYFSDSNIQEKMGLVIGDYVTVSGTSLNNFVNRPISGFGTLNSGGSYVVINERIQPIYDEVGASGTITFYSKYDVLPDGCAINPADIDLNEFIDVKSIWGANFPEVDIYSKDDIDANDFIAKELLKPFGLYSIPRKGKISVGITNPPLATESTKQLDDSNVIGPSSIKISRSTNSRFYNSVVYKYEEDALENKFLRGTITQSADSTNRIPIGNKPMFIESKGLRKGTSTQNFITFQTRRFLDRYKYGAESLKIQTNYKTGFDIEIGDVVIFDGSNMNVADITNGTRDFDARLMEVINKDLSIVDGNIMLELLDTAFLLDGRYATISPSSIVDTGSTTELIKIKNSFGYNGRERDKWAQYVGETITVHSLDFTVTGDTTIIGFDTVSGGLIVSPALGFTPSEGYIIEAPDYPTSIDPGYFAKWKRLHAFFQNVVNVTSGASGLVFDVDDTSTMVVGKTIEVYNSDYSNYSESEITDITGSTITVGTDLGFTPDSSYDVLVLGFFDGLAAYRIL